ncbi:hypothetical protein D3C85_1860950 [compost metagenome]
MHVVSLNGKEISESVDGGHYLELAPGDVCIVSFPADNPVDNADPCMDGPSGGSDRTIALQLLYEDSLSSVCQTHSG